MNKEDYIKLLNAHDWTYHYSDDHSVYESGRAKAEKLLSLANDNEEFKTLYAEHHKKIFG